MNLAIDIGNTAVKWATFEGGALVEAHSTPLATLGSPSPNLGEELNGLSIGQALVCASGDLTKVQPWFLLYKYQ